MYIGHQAIVKLTTKVLLEEDIPDKVEKSTFYISSDTTVDLFRKEHCNSELKRKLDYIVIKKMEAVAGKFWIYSEMIPRQHFSLDCVDDLNDKLWYALPSLTEEESIEKNIQHNDHHLQLHDIIQLGKIKFAVIGLNLPNQCEIPIDIDTSDPIDVEATQNNLPIFDSCYDNKQTLCSSDYVCIICLNGGDYDNNPLLNLCLCKGGTRYSHIKCIRNWMGTKTIRKVNDKGTIFTYCIKSFMCDVCKTPYPYSVEYKNKILNLVDVHLPSYMNYYVILESLNFIKEGKFTKLIYVIVLTDNIVTIGRSKAVDMRIDDMSISRLHAVIKFTQGKVVIRDTRSKYGSSVLMKSPMCIKDYPLVIKTRRALIKARLCKIKEDKDSTLNI